MMRIILVIVSSLIIAAGGCGGGDSAGGGGTRVRTTTVTEQDAVSIAQTEIGNRESWSASAAEYEAKPTANGWMVSVWEQAGRAGAFRLVMIDENGNVIKYQVMN